MCTYAKNIDVIVLKNRMLQYGSCIKLWKTISIDPANVGRLCMLCMLCTRKGPELRFNSPSTPWIGESLIVFVRFVFAGM